MNVKILISIAVALSVSFSTFSQTSKNFREDAQLLKKVILENHFSPRIIDDKFSALLFDQFIDELDPHRLYFTVEDLTSLYEYRQQLDNELNSNSWVFVPFVTTLYKKSLERAQSISSVILQAPIALESKDLYQRDTTWAMNVEALKKRWTVWVQLRTLVHLREIAKDSKAQEEKKNLIALEPKAREKTKPEVSRLFKRVINHPSGFENRVASLYVQAIAAVFDPHTVYYQPGAVEEFFSDLSSEGYFFGFAVNENEKGEIIIEQLTPGGPAWKSGVLNSGDVVRELKWEGQEAVDVAGASVEEINEVLKQNIPGGLEIKVAKAGEVIQTVKLKKEKLRAEDNIVRSYIFSGNGRKVGYISLPGFYSNWGTNDGSRCATDVAREIVKLKKENIDGLVMDLRFNGGGSMYDAVEMAGIFIDAGPIGVVKDRAGTITPMKDMNRGTIYDGPMIVMVNRGSASASEFFAAALQDYNRAVIVGGKTYGKATMQNILPLKSLPAKSGRSIPGVGYSKVTTEKIYRITGRTIQTKGLEPDIHIPDIFDSLDFGEIKSKLALPADTITKKIYYTSLAKIKIAPLRAKSQSRIGVDKNFAAVQSASGLFASWMDTSAKIPLNYIDFSKLMTQRASTMKNLDVALPKKRYSISQNQFENERMSLDSFAAEISNNYIAKLEKDLGLEETLNIMCDFIELTSQKK